MSESCDLCGGASEILNFKAKCHPSAPLRAEFDNETGRLTLYCYVPECNKKVASFGVMKREEDRCDTCGSVFVKSSGCDGACDKCWEALG